MIRIAIAHLRAQWMGALALFLVIAGGTAYAAGTVFSTDIVDGEVKGPDIAANAVGTGKIANNQVFSEDVRDDTLTNGGLKASDLSPDSVGASEIAPDSVGDSELTGIAFLLARQGAIGDAVDGVATDQVLIDRPDLGFQIISRCNNAGGGGVTSKVLIKTTGGIPLTMSVDSDAPGGQVDDTGIAHGTLATLASFGPTTAAHWGGGDYEISTMRSDDGINTVQFTGTVGVAANVGPDCRFEVTAVN